MVWNRLIVECFKFSNLVKHFINQYYSNYAIKGTRPALTMSVPVRYPTAVEDTAEPMEVGDGESSSIAVDTMRERMMLIGGRLGTPDAAPIATEWDPKYYLNTELQQLQCLPALSHEELFVKLDEALSLEKKYQPTLNLPPTSEVSGHHLNRFFCSVSDFILFYSILVW